MRIDTFKKLYIGQLADLHSAESQLCEALPKLAEAASDADLKTAFMEHLEQTVEQRDHIEQGRGSRAARQLGRRLTPAA